MRNTALRFYSQFCVVSTRRLSEGIMADLRTGSREFLTEFIHMYREYPCLWKVKGKEYSDRVKKNLAYEHLTAKLKEIDPDANKEKLFNNINFLRSCFRKQLKKVNDSKVVWRWGRRYRTHRACGYFLQTRKFRERESVIWNHLRIQITER